MNYALFHDYVFVYYILLFDIRSQPIFVDSPGRSNARFFITSDKMYILKTLTSEEVEQMHALLKQYHPVCPFLVVTLIHYFVPIFN